MGFSESVRTCFFEKFIDFTGRASRSEFWWFQLALWLFMVASGLVFGLLIGVGGSYGGGGISMVLVFVLAVVYLAIVIPSLAVMVRRLHDIDMSGWWVLGFVIANMIPVVGWITFFVMLYLLVKEGTAGANRFGENPLGVRSVVAAPAE